MTYKEITRFYLNNIYSFVTYGVADKLNCSIEFALWYNRLYLRVTLKN